MADNNYSPLIKLLATQSEILKEKRMTINKLRFIIFILLLIILFQFLASF